MVIEDFQPRVSIIIPVYNGSNYLEGAIDSALAQTYENIEILVINDGSSDKGKTDEICRSYGDKIRYISKENGGVATALNRGIEEMSGEYFSWLSHDDEYYPNKIEEQIKFLNVLENKRVILFSNVEYIDENSNLLYKTNYEDLYSMECLNSGMFSSLKGIVNGCTILMHKSILIKIGLFNENLVASNDYELWFRLAKSCEFRFIPKVLTKYRFHSQQGTRTLPKNVRVEESDTVWNQVISASQKYIEKLEIDIFIFYYDLGTRMLKDSRKKSYESAMSIAKNEYNNLGPDITIIMPCYNAEKYLEEAIQSILNQTLPNFELLIINDSSTDNSMEIIQRYKDRDFRINCLTTHRQEGVAKVMNIGLKAALGKKYITRMDADDISLPRRIEKQKNFLDKNKEYGFCAVNMEAFGNNNIPFLFEETTVPLEWLFLFSNPIASANTMYRADIIRKNKIKYGNYKVASDYDFLCKVLFYAKPFMLYEESLYRYRIYGESIFQKNKSEAMINSIKINQKLIEKMFGIKVPSWHKQLTTFGIGLDLSNDISPYDLVLWMQELLRLGNKKWKWDKEKYDIVVRDSESRLRKEISRSVVSDIESEISFTRERLQEIDKNCVELYKQNISLKNKLEEKESIIHLKEIDNTVFTIIKHAFSLIREQGLKQTIRNISQKYKNKVKK